MLVDPGVIAPAPPQQDQQPLFAASGGSKVIAAPALLPGGRQAAVAGAYYTAAWVTRIRKRHWAPARGGPRETRGPYRRRPPETPLQGYPETGYPYASSATGFDSTRRCKGVLKRDIPTTSCIQEMAVIFQGDINRLICHSQLPAAEEFEREVMEVILPAIQQTGSYAIAPAAPRTFSRARSIASPTPSTGSTPRSVFKIHSLMLKGLCKNDGAHLRDRPLRPGRGSRRPSAYNFQE